MKQNFLINIHLECDKCRSKAMKIVVGVSGVESAAFKGDNKNQIEVTGDGMDPVVMTRLLRKKVGYAELVSVGPVVKKKEEKPKEPEPKVQSLWPYQGGVPHSHFYVVTDINPDPCSIM